jgi:RecA-family ATPase
MMAAEKLVSDFESLARARMMFSQDVIIPLSPLTKKPLLKGWRAVRENTPEQLSTWGREYPNAMLGLLAGEPSGFFAIDLDVKPERGVDGYASLNELEAQHGALPATRQTQTPGGGRHYYFKLPAGVRIKNRASQFAPGIDVRSTGGYVVGAGSVRSDGKEYTEPEGSALGAADAPPWLLFRAIFNKNTRDRLAARNIRCAADFGDMPPSQWEDRARELLRPLSRKGSPGALSEARKVRLIEYVKNAVAAECKAIAEAVDGERDDTIYASMTRCMSVIRGAEDEGADLGELEHEAFLDIAAAAESLGSEWNEDECTRKWDSLVDVVDPRDLSHVGLDATDKADPDDEFSDLGSSGAGPIFQRSMADRIDEPDVPDRFTIEKWMPEGYVTTISGRSGLGKTSTIIHAAACVAAGKPFFGFRVDEPGSVFGFMCENTTSHLNRMVRASCKLIEADHHEVAKRLHLESYVTKPALLWQHGKGPTELGKRLEAELGQRADVRLLILDSAVDVYEGPEIDRQAVSKFMMWLTGLAARHKLGVALICHESKSAEDDNDAHALSGSTAWNYKGKAQWRFKPDKRNDRHRIMKLVKHSFSDAAPPLALEWRDGTFVCLTEDVERERACLDAAVRIFREAVEADRNLSPSRHAGNYIARVMNEREPRYSEAEFERAVQALEMVNIEVETYLHRNKERQRYRFKSDEEIDEE